ncbi:hypothetical protein SB658_27195, partial [Bacillus sp. SIMBA_008]
DITVTDGEAGQAAEIANTVASSFQDAVQETLEQPAVEGAVSPVQITVTEPAVTPTQPTSPNVRMLIILGGIIGLAVGIA